MEHFQKKGNWWKFPAERKLTKMYETPETDYHIACCDYCGEEIELHCSWAAFQQRLKAEGWSIVRGKTGQMTCHVCPDCKSEGITIN